MFLEILVNHHTHHHRHMTEGNMTTDPEILTEESVVMSEEITVTIIPHRHMQTTGTVSPTLEHTQGTRETHATVRAQDGTRIGHHHTFVVRARVLHEHGLSRTRLIDTPEGAGFENDQKMRTGVGRPDQGCPLRVAMVRTFLVSNVQRLM